MAQRLTLYVYKGVIPATGVLPEGEVPLLPEGERPRIFNSMIGVVKFLKNRVVPNNAYLGRDHSLQLFYWNRVGGWASGLLQAHRPPFAWDHVQSAHAMPAWYIDQGTTTSIMLGFLSLRTIYLVGAGH